MTEAEFNACGDPETMLKWLRDRDVLSERKARLFAVACCRRILREIDVDAKDVRAVDVAERYADGEASAADLEAAATYVGGHYSARRTAAFACRDSTSREPAATMADCTSGNASWAFAEHSVSDYNNPAFAAILAAEKAEQAAILRDVLGPLPFRPVRIDLSWLTPVVLELARRAYEQRSFDLMPALGAALSDAGCNEPEVLRHCAIEGTHVRGCFVVDLILGKD